jgi:tRNA pseudouridine38-40 synthase
MTLQRIALGLEYAGNAFSGWQTQPQGGTVQDALEHALSTVANAPVSVICAGRTDAGVHALGQVVHFDTTAQRPDSAWVRGVNAHLPDNVAVRWMRPVDGEFHARYHAYGRRYRYLLLNRPQRAALWHGRIGWFHRPLDLAAMQEAAARLPGTHDFSAFRAAACQAKSPVKEMRLARVTRQGDLFLFDFEASAFLHHMVRNLVGSLVQIGKGEKSPDWMDTLLQMKDRRQAAPTFAPDGLYFLGPVYEPHWGLPESSVQQELDLARFFSA